MMPVMEWSSSCNSLNTRSFVNIVRLQNYVGCFFRCSYFAFHPRAAVSTDNVGSNNSVALGSYNVWINRYFAREKSTTNENILNCLCLLALNVENCLFSTYGLHNVVCYNG